MSTIALPSAAMGRKLAYNASKVINFALRVVTGRRKFDHISDVLEELGWPSPTARQLHKQHSLRLLHKILVTGEPQALASQIRANPSLRASSIRQDADLALPRVRTESGKRYLLYSTVQYSVFFLSELEHIFMTFYLVAFFTVFYQVVAF